MKWDYNKMQLKITFWGKNNMNIEERLLEKSKGLRGEV